MDKSRKELRKQIDEIFVFLHSGMCPPKDREHFEKHLKDLTQIYEQPE